jgi:hypothetical protein
VDLTCASQVNTTGYPSLHHRPFRKVSAIQLVCLTRLVPLKQTKLNFRRLVDRVGMADLPLWRLVFDCKFASNSIRRIEKRRAKTGHFLRLA